MPRLAQPKSKRGCRRCKQRKVKCDEIHPTCGACARHSTPCEYDVTFVVTNPGESSKSRTREKQRSTSLSPATRTQGGSLSPSGLLVRSGSSSSTPGTREPDNDGRDRLQELRLLHHYTAFTCQTFLSSTTADVWRDVVPQLGFEHQFVLDMVLSLSALHMSRLYPDNSEHLYANTEYYNRAIQAHRASVQNIDSANAEAVFATTVLIAFQSFVALGNPNGRTDGSYELPLQWLKLSSGTRHLLDACMPHIIFRGRLTGLFQDGNDVLEESLFLDPESLDSLEDHARWDLDPPAGGTEGDRMVYRDTFRRIGSIHQAIRNGENPRNTCRRITTVPAKAPERFVEMVEERQPRAIAIVGHMFALLALVEGDQWWFEGITQHQITGIRDNLPSDWHPLMFAPVQKLQEARELQQVEEMQRVGRGYTW